MLVKVLFYSLLALIVFSTSLISPIFVPLAAKLFSMFSRLLTQCSVITLGQ